MFCVAYSYCLIPLGCDIIFTGVAGMLRQFPGAAGACGDAERREMKAEETLRLLESEPAKELMVKLYGADQAEENAGR